jgi:phosphoribosyl 1,2-cyclic phosphodiesterase
MGDIASQSVPDDKPIKNLRIRFWGVQGSCPFFPEAHEVADYERAAAMKLLTRVFQDVEAGSHKPGGCKVEDILGGPISPATIENYQRRLGTSELPVYGGDTTCVSVETSDGKVMFLDGGSGIRNASKFFIKRWPANRARQIHILGTHEHLDHRSGLPFSQFCFVRPEFNIQVFGSAQFLHALDDRYGVFSRKITDTTYLDDPIDYRVMSASFSGFELRNPEVPDFRGGSTPDWLCRDISQPVQIGATKITAFDVYHGLTRCISYKIQHGPVSFVFCTDHEIRHGPDPFDPRQAQSKAAEQRLREHIRGVDLAYVDGQYFRDEYDGKKGIGVTMQVKRIDWGHGCIEDVVARAAECGVQRTLIGHHDPERTWVDRLAADRWLDQQCEGKPYKIELAKGESVVDI